MKDEEEELQQKEGKLAKMKKFLRTIPQSLSTAGRKLPTPIKKALPVAAATASGIVAPPLLAPIVGGFLYQLIKTHAPSNIQINEEKLLKQAEQTIIKKGLDFSIEQLLDIFDDTATKHDIETLQVTLQKALNEYHSHLLEAISHLERQPNDVKASLEFIAEEIADLQEARELNHLILTRLDDVHARIQRGFQRISQSLEALGLLLDEHFIKLTKLLTREPLTKTRLFELSSLQLHSVPMSSGNDWSYLEDLYVHRDTEEESFIWWKKSLNPRRFSQNLFLVIGEAGMGKTWFLARQAHQTAEHDPAFFIPVRTSTRSLGFKTYLETEVFHKPFHQVIADIHHVRRTEDSHFTTYFFIDGLDEVKPTERQAILRDILSLHQQQGIAIVLSCRYHDWMTDPQIKILKNQLDDMVYLNERLLKSRKDAFSACASCRTSACLAEFTDKQLEIAMLRHDLPEIPQELWNLAKKPFVFRLLVSWYHQQGHLPNPHDVDTMIHFITGTTNSIFERMGISANYREQAYHLIETLIQNEDPRPYVSDLMTLDAQVREFLLSCGIFQSKESSDGVIIYLNPDLEPYLLLKILHRRKKNQRRFKELLTKTIKIFPQYQAFLEQNLHGKVSSTPPPPPPPKEKVLTSTVEPSTPSHATITTTPTTPSRKILTVPPTVTTTTLQEEKKQQLKAKILDAIEVHLFVYPGEPIRLVDLAQRCNEPNLNVIKILLEELIARDRILKARINRMGTDALDDDILELLSDDWNQEVTRWQALKTSLLQKKTNLQARIDHFQQQLNDPNTSLQVIQAFLERDLPALHQDLQAFHREVKQAFLQLDALLTPSLKKDLVSLQNEFDTMLTKDWPMILTSLKQQGLNQLERLKKEEEKRRALVRELTAKVSTAIAERNFRDGQAILERLDAMNLTDEERRMVEQLRKELEQLRPVEYHGHHLLKVDHQVLQELEQLLGTTIPVKEDVSDEDYDFGVVIDENTNHVVKLALDEQGLNSLPESILRLSSLQVLSLASNQLTSLPESFGQLHRLQRLWLNGNQLTSLPESFGRLTNLQWLDLGGNQLNSLPESFGQLHRLEYLDLEGNQLNSLPESILRLSNLQVLDLGYNQLSSLPESFGHLTSLKRLNLGDNQLNSLPESITSLTNLTYLNLSNNLGLRLSRRQEQWLKELKKKGCTVYK